VLAHTGDYDEAEEAAEHAIEICHSIGHSLLIAEVTNTLAFIALRRGAFAQAGERAEEAAALFLDLGAAPRAQSALELATRAWEELGEEERARATRARARDAFTETQA
jgi:tetratricopeptide (TPR) repeat protein